MTNSGNTDFSSLDDIEFALSCMGICIHDADETDPSDMAEMFKNINLNIDELDQGLEGVAILKRLLTEKISIAPLKKMIFLGIKKNPCFYKTIIDLSKAQQQKILLNKDQKTQLHYSIYFLVILQVLTQLMANDKNFEFAIVKLLAVKRGSVNPGSTFWNFVHRFRQTNWNFFSALKLVSINPFMLSTIVMRHYWPCPSEAQLQSIIKDYGVTGFNAFILKQEAKTMLARRYGGIIGNILQALVMEKSRAGKNACQDNIKSGLALILYLERNQDAYPPMVFANHAFILPDPNEMIRSSLTDTFWPVIFGYQKTDNIVRTCPILNAAWTNLYEAWNMAFVLRSLPERHHLFLPKLLIPATLLCAPQDYMVARIISLWLTINFESAIRSKGIKIDYPSLDTDHWLDQFGENNLEYAKRELLTDISDFEEIYAERIARPWSITNYIRAIRLVIS